MHVQVALTGGPIRADRRRAKRAAAAEAAEHPARVLMRPVYKPPTNDAAAAAAASTDDAPGNRHGESARGVQMRSKGRADRRSFFLGSAATRLRVAA